MKLSESIWQYISSGVMLIYTLIMCSRFSSWGVKSRLVPFAKLESPNLIAVGSNVHICEHAWLNACDDRNDGLPTLTIGDGTYIGRFVHINAWRNVKIGTNVLIADRVFITDCGHKYDDINTPIRLQNDVFLNAVNLCDGCWIGIGAVILSGVTVGRNAVVGANAVVTKNVPDFAVVVGVPAKVIEYLDERA